MSRSSKLTTTDVIKSGEYLEPDFDPNTLTIPLLLGVLGYHNIPYPTAQSKAKLVKVFNDEVKSKAATLKAEHLKRTNSTASDDGILDGITGQPLRQNQPLERRSSRRISRAPPEPEPEIPKRPEPVKRRRSSAQPALGRPSTSKVTLEPPVIEESESEVESQPARKVGRRKKASEAASNARRSSTHAEDSGWEDNNIFQSGVDSPSPKRPSPIKTRIPRKSIGPKKPRISASAPPETPSSPVRDFPPPTIGSPISPPQSNFNPQLPQFRLPSVTPQPSPSGPRLSGLAFTSPLMTGREPLPPPPDSDDELNVISAQGPPKEETQEVPEEETVEEPADFIREFSPMSQTPEEEQVTAVAQLIAAGGKQPLTKYEQSSKPKSVSASTVMGYLTIIIGVLSTIIVYQPAYARIGYCERGTDSNEIVRQLKQQRLEVEACQKQALLSEDNGDPNASKGCPPLPISALVVPERCTPCPEHGTCTNGLVVCDTGYILRSHPLLFLLPPPSTPRNSNASYMSLSFTDMCYKGISTVLDGFPGFGSVALPPRCIEDPNRKRNIGALGKAIESLLGQERGRRLCAGTTNGPIIEADGGDAKKWGVDLEILREVMKKKTRRPELLATFDDTFDEAIQQLIQYGGAITGEDRQYHRFIAHQTPDLTWDCVVTVKSRELWQEWKVSVFGLLLLAILGKYTQSRLIQSRKDAKRVTELVQVVLDTLRNQEMQHHVDPVTYPQPYLSSMQLRDLILQDEHSVNVRSRLWERVEKVVEGNANVRANLEEVVGGDEMRIWTWVGSGRGGHLEGSPLGANVENDYEEEGPEDPKAY